MAIRIEDPFKITGPVIISGDRLAADRDTHGKCDDDAKDLHNDPDNGKGNIGPVKGLGPLEPDHVVGHTHDDDNGNLRDKAGDAQLADLPQQPAIRKKTGLREAKGFRLPEIEDGDEAGNHLTDDGGYGCAPHPHVKYEDGDRVQNQVQHGTDYGGKHGISGGAVGPDRRIHAGGENIEGDSEQNDLHVFSGIGIAGLCHSKQAENLIRKQKAGHGQQEADDYSGQNSITDAFVAVFLVAASEGEA